jgi:hypothetical protein
MRFASELDASANSFVDFRRDIAGRKQRVHFEIGTGLLARIGRSRKSIGHVIVLGCTQLLDTILADMVIGEEQTVCRHERTGPAIVESHGGALQVAQKIVSDGEAISLQNLLPWEVVKKPHSLVTPGKNRKNEPKKQYSTRH